MTGVTRSSEGLDPRRRRILFRAWHRGIREMDLIMGRFAEVHVGDMTEAELEAFETLMGLPDPDVFAWITGEQPPPTEYETALLAQLRDFHLNTSEHK
jgi:antitoxin CptB